MGSGGGAGHDTVEEKIVVGLAKVGQALRSNAWQRAGARGLTPTQAQILALLHQRGKTETRLGDVARALAVTPATASDAVGSLIRKALVKKAQASDDARAITLTLTARGHRAAARIAEWPEFLLGAMSTLNDQEKEILYRGLLKVIRELQDRDKIPLSRMCFSCDYFRRNVHAGEKRPHHCAFVDAPLGDRDLRIECPDHRQELAQIRRAKTGRG